jgi:hypothetical protein
MAELKDCPFCGAEMTIIPVGPVAWRLDSAFDHHDDCILLGRTFDVVKSDAQREALENHWNTRADEARAELAEQEHVSAAEERDHLRVRLSDAQASLQSLAADTARLDWLDKNPGRIKHSIGYRDSRDSWVWTDGNGYGHDAVNLRTAIDAARAAADQGGAS